MKLTVLIDNGHGEGVKGKRSPDGSLLEWEWTREVAALVDKGLKTKGINSILLVPETQDISLTERCRRANIFCQKYGKINVLLLSLHLNAAGNGSEWKDATGFSSWVAKVASQKSKDFAAMCTESAHKRGLKGNRCVPACKYWSSNFSIITNTACPAVLTENLFMDNKQECEWLKKAENKQLIADLHIEAIMNYINKYNLR